MNITQTAPTEKTKRKAKPRIDRYSQPEAAFIIVMAFALMFLFLLPILIGAIAMMPLLAPAAIGVSIVIIIIFFLLLGHSAILGYGTSCCLSTVGTLIFLGAGFGIFILAWFSVLTVYLIIPIALFSVLVLMLYFLAKIKAWKRLLARLESPMKLLSLLLLPCTISLILFFAYTSMPYEPINHISIDDTNYYLVLDRGFLDPVQVQLYECNHLSINCERTYSTYDDFGPSFNFNRFRDTAEMHQGDQDNILVLIDGEVVYDSGGGSP